MNKSKSRQYPKVFWISLIVNYLLLLINIYRWEFNFVIMMMLEEYVEKYLFFLLIILTIWTAIIAIYNTNNIKREKFIPFIVNIVTILVITFVPFTDIYLQYEFKSKLKTREKVVNMIDKNEIRIEVCCDYCDVINLPIGLQNLSKGGEIIVDKKIHGELIVIFYTFIGMADNFSGFLYSSNNKPPDKKTCGGDIIQVVPMKENWYFVVYT